VVVPATLKIGTMKELIALAKKQNAEGRPLRRRARQKR
jgi:hypothetical protein